jgi:hypothetical protein
MYSQSCSIQQEDLPAPCSIENQIFTWFGHNARAGVKWKLTSGWR